MWNGPFLYCWSLIKENASLARPEGNEAGLGDLVYLFLTDIKRYLFDDVMNNKFDPNFVIVLKTSISTVLYYPFKKYVKSERVFFQFGVQACCHLSPCLNDHNYS